MSHKYYDTLIKYSQTVDHVSCYRKDQILILQVDVPNLLIYVQW